MYTQIHVVTPCRYIIHVLYIYLLRFYLPLCFFWNTYSTIHIENVMYFTFSGSTALKLVPSSGRLLGNLIVLAGAAFSRIPTLIPSFTYNCTSYYYKPSLVPPSHLTRSAYCCLPYLFHILLFSFDSSFHFSTHTHITHARTSTIQHVLTHVHA